MEHNQLHQYAIKYLRLGDNPKLIEKMIKVGLIGKDGDLTEIEKYIKDTFNIEVEGYTPAESDDNGSVTPGNDGSDTPEIGGSDTLEGDDNEEGNDEPEVTPTDEPVDEPVATPTETDNTDESNDDGAAEVGEDEGIETGAGEE